MLKMRSNADHDILYGLCGLPGAHELNADTCFSILKTAVLVSKLLDGLVHAIFRAVWPRLKMWFMILQKWQAHTTCWRLAQLAACIHSIVATLLTQPPIDLNRNLSWCFCYLLQFRNTVGVITLLTRLPAVQELPVYNIISLLGAAVHAKLPLTVHEFCQLPAAQQMTSATAYNLLQSAVALSSAEMVTAICRNMQQAGHLRVLQIASLLQAVQGTAAIPGRTQQLTALIALPGAAALDAATVTRPIVAVLSSADSSVCEQNVEALEALCSLAAQREIHAHTCLDLLMIAVQVSQTRSSHLAALLQYVYLL